MVIWDLLYQFYSPPGSWFITVCVRVAFEIATFTLKGQNLISGMKFGLVLLVLGFFVCFVGWVFLPVFSPEV